MREVGLSDRFCPSVCLTPRAHAQSGDKQSVLFVSLSVCVSSKFWANHDNEGSKPRAAEPRGLRGL